MTRTRIALSFVITLILGVATGLLFGMLAVPPGRRVGRLVGLGLLLAPRGRRARPRVLGAVGRLVLRLTRRPPADTAMSGRACSWPSAARASSGWWAGCTSGCSSSSSAATPAPACRSASGRWRSASALGPCSWSCPRARACARPCWWPGWRRCCRCGRRRGGPGLAGRAGPRRRGPRAGRLSRWRAEQPLGPRRDQHQAGARRGRSRWR